ncbi:PucR family transcriptional regulator [Saccharopolyspora rhizosphaerae]|uniref:PucR family transcriptional regulator n=1 Tax=Saccharopolyspora rhizosphaerae TaxID=2492662 RepID=A0A426JLN5_9PSEU|nr:helix-turn-helix domain-containing protein [Saccharopolyspora rhizosphaerae]RRO14119.1 PucR family transcriptional regulator [Saccharopolyspora rhizosphaerae]
MVKLDRLINVLGGYGAHLVCAPRSRATELRAVALHDPTEQARGGDEVLLAVGVDEGRAAEVLAQTSAVVVVFRLDGLGEAALAVARDREIAVLLVDPAVSWGQLAGVVYGLVLEGRETEAGRGPTDLFALADALAESLGGPVTIEDHRSGVLAYSRRQEAADQARLETILGRRVPEEIRRELSERGVFRHLATSDEPLFVEPSGSRQGRAVVAVRAGKSLLGSIWVGTPSPLDAERQSALMQASRTAAAHLLRTRASADLERQVESDLVIGLVEGHSDVATVLRRLGFRGDRFRVVAVQAHNQGEHDSAALLVFELATVGFGWSRPGRSALFANTVYTILPHEDGAPAREWVRALAREMPAGVEVFAGIGGAAGLDELVDSRREADESLAVHAAKPAGSPAVVYDDSWHEVLLRRLQRVAASGRAPERGPVARLRRHDREHGGHLIATLRTWLEVQGDLGAAAARLEIHPNTVRNRMRRATQVGSLDLDDPDTRLALIIALAADQ